MKRIGIIADNHSRTTDGADLPQAVLDAFSGVDLIVHCGDAGSWGALDRLATVAPVVGVQGGHNGTSEDPRIAGEKRVIDIGGLRAGVVHDLVKQGITTESNPRFLPVDNDLPAALRRFFDEDVDVLLYAGTHVARIGQAGGVFLVNPGSPTIPLDRAKGLPGTVAVVEVDGEIASARVIDLAR